MTTDSEVAPRRSDLPIFFLAALLGIAIGSVDVALNDLLFTALFVLMACMLLGALRPQWPWRWAVVVGLSIPLTELAAFLIRTVKPSQAQIYGSFLTLLPGIAGAYGGAVVRGVFNNLREGR